MRIWKSHCCCIVIYIIMMQLTYADEAGLYIEADIGLGKVNLNANGKNTGTVIGGAIGYLSEPMIGIEINTYFFPNVDNVSKDNMVVATAIKGIIPISYRWNIIAKLGVGIAHTKFTMDAVIHDKTVSRDQTKNIFVGLFALGTQYDLNDYLGIHIQGIATTPDDPVPSMYAILGGLTLLF